MRNLLLTCLFITGSWHGSLFSQTTPAQTCYDQPISLISNFDAPSQNEFASFTDIWLKNSAGANLYCVLNNSSNPLKLTAAQVENKNLALSFSYLASTSGIQLTDGTTYTVWCLKL